MPRTYIKGLGNKRKRRVGQKSSSIPDAYEIPLTRGKIAIVDEIDFSQVSNWSWSIWSGRCEKWYARANVGFPDGTRRYMAMHIFIMNPTKGFEVDHIDGNGLNNRRGNLRVCTHQENMMNIRSKSDSTSKHKGVSFFKRDNCWRAYIVIDAKQKHIGYFDSEIEAAIAYNDAAKSLFGSFAKLNSILEESNGQNIP